MARCVITLLPLCFLFFLLLCPYSQGDDQQCPPNITQRLTGHAIMGRPQWEVTIWMGCHCNIYSLVVTCPFFGSTDPSTNPAIIQNWVPDLCLINQGYPLYGHEAYKFTYAWTWVDIQPSLFKVNCTKY